jgi:hypothetical protein
VAVAEFSIPDLLSNLGDKAFHFLFFRQFHGVAGDEDLIAQVAEGELDERVILAGAEENADGRQVAWGHLVFFIVGDVGVELAEMFVAEGIRLEFHQDVALEHAVVKDEVDEEVFVADEDALLPGLEAEAMTQLEKEILESIQQGVFQVRLGHDIPGTQAEELEDVGIPDDVDWLEPVRSGVSHGGELCFIFGEAAAFVIEAGDLAAQLADRPISPDALDLVETALGGVWEFRKLAQVGEGQAVNEFGMGQWWKQ